MADMITVSTCPYCWYSMAVQGDLEARLLKAKDHRLIQKCTNCGKKYALFLKPINTTYYVMQTQMLTKND